jgi:GT2 family glycosyltransferase
MSETQQKGEAKVTLVVVNWNSERFLERCLIALMAQSVKPYEIILVDNASTDASLDIVRCFPAVRLLAQKKNHGFARGNNLAIEVADVRSEWVALLNPDAFPEPDWLERLVEAANSEPDAAAFGSRQIIYESPNLLDGTGDTYHISGLVWRERHGKKQQPTDLVQREIFSPCAAADLYRRQTIVDVGGFDEDFFCYMEDVDLGFRLRLAGHKAMYIPEAIVHHVGSATTGGKHSDFTVYHGHRNLVWTFVKNMPGLLFWVLLPLHLVMNMVSIVWFTLRGQGKVILRAKLDAIKGLPKMWRKRREIQSTRVASIKDIWRAIDKRLIPRLERRNGASKDNPA